MYVLCRVLQLRKAAQEKAHAVRAAVISQFKSMLREQGDITLNTRWSKVGLYVEML